VNEPQANGQPLELSGVDPITQLPQPVQLSRADLRQALLRRPDVLVGALRDLLERALVAPTPEGVSNTTKIGLFLTPGDLERLSSGAQQLTRGDLLALAGWGVPRKTPQELGLSVEDVRTLREVFGRQIGAELLPQGVSVSCCCCSPCCCSAAAVTDPMRAAS
jgi:hypothetical protein